MKPASPTRGRLTADAIRDAFTNLGLREEEKPIDGYAFTHWKEPHAAVQFYSERNGGREPTRFYIAQRMYVVAE